MKENKKSFLKQMSNLWPNLDFSNSIYVNYGTKIEFICPEHGTQRKLPKYIKKYGCGICSRKNTYKKIANSGLRKMTKSEFVVKSNNIHDNKYDYSLVDYKGSHENVIIVCPEHGQFIAKPHNHIRGIGCIKCRNESFSEKYRHTLDIFVEKAQSVHGNTYDYRLVDYKGSHENIIIICSEHGQFSILPYWHLNGGGCPKCSKAISRPHRKILEAFPDIEWSINDRKTI